MTEITNFRAERNIFQNDIIRKAAQSIKDNTNFPENIIPTSKYYWSIRATIHNKLIPIIKFSSSCFNLTQTLIN